MRRQRRQINSVSSCHKHENDPEESFQGSGRNIIVIMPLVNILHIHPPPSFCFVYGNVLMNLSSMLLDEAVTSTAPLCLFYGCAQNLIHHYLSVIMEIFWRFVGSSVTAAAAVCCFHKKIQKSLKERFSY